MSPPPRILAIAGSDSSGGAGIQADIKTITMLGGYAMTAVTAVTAQNTLGVQAVVSMTPQLVVEQFLACSRDIGIDAVKIGMVARPETTDIIGDLLRTLGRGTPVVLDPVMVASSGAVLNVRGTNGHLLALAEHAALVTPNLPELEALGGLDAVLGHCRAVLVKGGHAPGEVIVDRLVTADGEIARWEDTRIETSGTHGTGCTLSSAIATYLGHGLTLEDAIGKAREFVRAALLAAPGFGAGRGPMGHHAVR
ncbi:MAG: bifunctional hydroxymethylpyrimidine kinase/phosphomethylpyrimidine kinase [Croceibacterium sp.]